MRFFRAFQYAGTVTAALCAIWPAFAQSLSGIAVGDNISATSKLGVLPSATERMGPFTAQKWQLPDGNELSATTLSETGEIVYLESNWSGGESGVKGPVPGGGVAGR